MTGYNSLTSYGGASVKIPDYNGASIVHLPEMIRGLFTGDMSSGSKNLLPAGIDLQMIDQVIFVLVDGFGLAQWQKYQNEIRVLDAFEKGGSVEPIDTVFPSSTPVALTTLYSGGQSPATHGLVDWWMYEPSVDEVIVTLPFKLMGATEMDSLQDTGLTKETLYKGQTLFETMALDNIKSSFYINKQYVSSTYSQAITKGSEVVGYDTAVDLYGRLAEQVNGNVGKNFSYVYWGDIDATGHAYGPESIEHSTTTHLFFDEFEKFLRMLKKDRAEHCLCIVSADHGQLTVEPKKTIYLDEITGFDELLKISTRGRKILPWGGVREVFVAVEEGRLDDMLHLLQRQLADRVDVITSESALEAGLFGSNQKIHSDLRTRIGDIIILPRGNNTVWYHHPKGSSSKSIGQHGGLTNDELKIPLAIGFIDKLVDALK